jgi:structural maintenance of chromosome 4
MFNPDYQADGQDEIDAALDFKNVSIVANYIQSKTQAAQLYVPLSLSWAKTDCQHRHFPTKWYVWIGSSFGGDLQDLKCEWTEAVVINTDDQCTKSIAIDNKDLRTQAVPRPIAGPKNSVPPTPRPDDAKRRSTILEEDRRQSTASVSA